jgi:signal transduction histidine kinase
MTIDTQSQPSPPPGKLHQQDAAADVLDSLDAGVLVVDRRQTIVYRNASATEWLPDGAELASVFAHARFLKPFPGWPTVLSGVLERGESWRSECVFDRPHRSPPRLGELCCTPLREHGSERIAGAVIRMEEGLPRETLDAQVEVSKRLASLGKLAARVAHELNNPLDGILRYVNLALRASDNISDSKMKSYLTESRVGLMRMAQIVGDLLEFSRTTDGEFDEMTITEVVEEAIKVTSSEASENRVVVAADFQSEQMPAACGSRLYQVCCNLIRNAIQAMPNGGRVSITTGMVQEHVVIRVADTGEGLPEPPEKVFEPFFTTKEPGKGTGLGLAICKDFIEDMQGKITAIHAQEGGAVFLVRVPLSSFRRPSRLTSPRTGSRTDAAAELP